MTIIEHAVIRRKKGWFYLHCNKCDKPLFKSIKCEYEDRETYCEPCSKGVKEEEAEKAGDNEWDVMYPGMWSGWADEED